MNTYTDQLLQIFDGATWDGNLISKSARNTLVKEGFVDQIMGWNIITKEGVSYVLATGLRNSNSVHKINYETE